MLNTVLSLFYYLRVVKVMVFGRAGGRFRRDADGLVGGAVLPGRDGAAGGRGAFGGTGCFAWAEAACGGPVLKELTAMDPSDPIDVLNRLLRLLCRSLPVYLESTRPSDPLDPRDLGHRLSVIAADQRVLARRVADAISERKGQVEAGHFPLEFTAINDLALPYLVRRAIDYQKRDIEAMGECVEALAGEPLLLPLAQEILRRRARPSGDARGDGRSVRKETPGPKRPGGQV